MNCMYVVMTTRDSGRDMIHGLFTCYADAANTLENDVPEPYHADSYVVRLVCNNHGQDAVVMCPPKIIPK